MRFKNKSWVEEEIKTNPNVIFLNEDNKIESDLKKEILKNDEIELEIGSGKGDFIIESALKNPQKFYIGIDTQKISIGYISRKINNLDKPLKNLKIINLDANKIVDFFDDIKFNRIFLNHSDPWPKAGHEKRRLTYKNFLSLYKQILKKDGVIELKTDNRGLFDYSVTSFKDNGFVWDEKEDISYDLHSELYKRKGNIETEYERKFSSKGQPEFWIKVKEGK